MSGLALASSAGLRLARLVKEWIGHVFLPGQSHEGAVFVQAMLALAGIRRGAPISIRSVEVWEADLQVGDLLAFDLRDLGHGIWVGVYLGADEVAHWSPDSQMVTTFCLRHDACWCTGVCRPGALERAVA
jgi:hypothetical protein